MNEKYKDYSKYKCPQCRAEAPRENTYFHQESDHEILDILQNGAERPCPNECEFKWASQSSIRNHLLKNCENGFSQCEKCGTTMKRKDLKVHQPECTFNNKKKEEYAKRSKNYYRNNNTPPPTR